MTNPIVGGTTEDLRRSDRKTTESHEAIDKRVNYFDFLFVARRTVVFTCFSRDEKLQVGQYKKGK
jgi:hypothetical protein